MKERNGQPNAISEGAKLSASLSVNLSLADPQSAKQTNVIWMKERNGPPNAIFKGEKLSVSLSASPQRHFLIPQFAKQTNNVITINETNQWADNQMQDSNAKS